MWRGRLITLLACCVWLVVWPPAAEPFHEPKRWLFAVAAALAVASPWRWTALPLIVVCSLRPQVEWVAFAWAMAAFPAVKWWRPLEALTWAGVLVAAVVGLQAWGVDPFAGFGPAALTPRLARYGTLGNPDFVASVLVPLGVLSLGVTRWRWRTVLIALGVALTGSLAAVLGVAAAAVALVARRFTIASWPVLISAVLITCAPLIHRDLTRAMQGRVYLVQVALPHALDAPLLGGGPIVERWPQWELEHWQARCADAACVEAHPDGRFAGRQDHLHADWLELWLTRGLLGVLAFGLALAAPLSAAWKRADALVFAALVAALSRALVDFPLERPADLCLLAVVSALAFLPEPPCAPSPSS